MKSRLQLCGLAAAVLALALPAPGLGGSIYEVPELEGEVVGAWDVNIMADDVHFETAAVIRQVRLRLAVAGSQTCRLWIFDALNQPPLHTAVFSNVPALDQYDVTTYDIDLDLQVPRDIYVGFSAVGDGWNTTDSDYWSRGNVANRGVPGTAGEYYYGAVAGGQLTTAYSSGDSSYGCMQILAEPAAIDAVHLTTGQVELAVSNLPMHGTNSVESSPVPGGTNWVAVETLPAGASNHVWTAPDGGAEQRFYRVTTR